MWQPQCSQYTRCGIFTQMASHYSGMSCEAIDPVNASFFISIRKIRNSFHSYVIENIHMYCFASGLNLTFGHRIIQKNMNHLDTPQSIRQAVVLMTSCESYLMKKKGHVLWMSSQDICSRRQKIYDIISKSFRSSLSGAYWDNSSNSKDKLLHLCHPPQRKKHLVDLFRCWRQHIIGIIVLIYFLRVAAGHF